MKYLFLFFLVAPALAQVSYVPPGRILKRGATEFVGEGRMWTSTSRFDVDGKEAPYQGDESFSYVEGSILGRYGVTREMQFTFSANFRQNQAMVASPVSSQNYEPITSTGLQAVGGAVTYAFDPIDRMHYSFEAFYRYHPYTNALWNPAEPTEKFVLGDDGGDYGLGLIATYVHPAKNYLSFSGFFRRPGKEISTELNWDLQGALAWKNLALVAGVQGVYSLNQDAYSEDPLTKPPINTGGSSLYHSINRQFVAPYAGVNIALGKKWRLESRYQVITNPRSYDSGSLVSLALAMRTEPEIQESVDQKFKEYDIEGSVVKLSAKKQFAIIDKGLAHNVRKGQRFDFFYFDYVGGNVLLARGVVIQVNADQSVIKLTSRFSLKHEIKEGTVVRGLGQ